MQAADRNSVWSSLNWPLFIFVFFNSSHNEKWPPARNRMSNRFWCTLSMCFSISKNYYNACLLFRSNTHVTFLVPFRFPPPPSGPCLALSECHGFASCWWQLDSFSFPISCIPLLFTAFIMILVTKSCCFEHFRILKKNGDFGHFAFEKQLFELIVSVSNRSCFENWGHCHSHAGRSILFTVISIVNLSSK